MTLLRHSAVGFAALCMEGTIGARLVDQMSFRTGRSPSRAEVVSWERSLPVLAQDLIQAGLDEVEVLLEFHLPLTSKRADALLVGRHPTSGDISVVVVELKQWSAARTWDGDPELLTVAGTRGPRLHPVAQVRGYCEYLKDFSRALHDVPDPVAGAAYLHNVMNDADVEDLYGYPRSATGDLFTGARRGDFVAFLRSRLAPSASGAPYADLLGSAGAAPSRELLSVAADEVQRRERFTLLDEQRRAYSLVLHAVQRSRAADHKTVVLVTGGPGSGKSVIALSVLGELARRGRTVVHATGSRSFTQTLRKVAGARSPRTKQLFKYFNQFMDSQPNDLDVIILDEAHRIRETSVDRYTKAELRTGRPQIDELMSVARVPVFLLDQHQVVRPGELGTAEDIERYASERGYDVHRVDLDEQFRCGGSEEYIDWVRRLLGLEPGGPRTWLGDPFFEVRVADTPDEMEAFLRARLADGLGARIAAGYCWPWSDPRSDGSLVPDVRIHEWARPWNLKGDRSIGGAPPAALWASDPAGFEQVGCVYTAQGFEYGWAGVIIGPDLVWRDGEMVSVRSANKDPDFRSTTRVSDAEFNRLVRNVYKVLLTRGMNGVVLYSTDAETREALRELSRSGEIDESLVTPSGPSRAGGSGGR